MVKKFLYILLSALMLTTGIVTSFGAETPLSVIYFTNMNLQNGFNNMSRLTDGIYTNSPIVVPVSASAELDDSYYIEGFFAGNIVKLSSVEVGCWENQIGKQDITKVRIDRYNSKDRQWETVIDSRELEWNADRAEIRLPEEIYTAAVRFYIQDANRIWNNFRIEELRMFGTVEGTVENISNEASSKIDFGLQSGTEASLCDGNFLTEIVSTAGTKPTAETPLSVTLDYGEVPYKIDNMIIGERFGRDAGITEADIYYKTYGIWKKLKSVSFSYGKGYSTDNYEIAETEIGIEASGIKLVITNANTSWNNFRIGEILLKGVKSESSISEITNNAKITYPESKILPYTVSIEAEYAFEPKALKLSCSGVSGAEAGLNIGGSFVTLSECYDFSENEPAILEFAEGIETDVIELKIISADENFSIDDLALYGENISDKVNPLINTFKESGKYSDYEAAISAAESIKHEKTKAKLTEEIEAKADEQRGKQQIGAEFEAKTGKLTINGYLFTAESDNMTVRIKGENSESDIAAVVDENGNMSLETDFSSNPTGKYTISVTLGEKEFTAEFIKREVYSGNDILSFSIDGVTASVSEKSITLTLPSYGTLKDRIAVFKLSDGADAECDGKKLISGETPLDYTSSKDFKITAENGESKVYTVTAKLAKASVSGGGSGGGGGSKGSKTNMDIVLPTVPVKPAESERFADVTKTHWAYEYIEEMAKDKIVNGWENNLFYPDKNIKREEFVKILTGILNLKPIDGDIFKDASENWSSGYINTAYQNKLVTGISDNTFGIGLDISREDMAVIIYRSLPDNLRNTDISKAEKFADDGDISDYAKTAVYTLKALDILNGFDGRFNPKAGASRAEAVKMLYSRRKI